MDRENFYEILTKILNSLEDETYVYVVGKNKTVHYKDLNIALVTIYDTYNIVNDKNQVFFDFDMKSTQYYDFGYYRGESFNYNNDIIDIFDIKNILVSNMIEFPYLNILYKIILDKYNNIKDKDYVVSDGLIYINNSIRLIFNNDEIDNIISIIKEYKIGEEKLSKRVRKKEF